MQVGTRSLLVGAHCFFIHPFAVWIGCLKIYGWTWSLPKILSFFLHDVGYIGKPNIDGPEGKTHPEIGAEIVGMLCDWRNLFKRRPLKWYWFTLLHSRHYSKLFNVPHSPLCVADKLAFCKTPYWLYRFHMWASPDECKEYLENSYGRTLFVIVDKPMRKKTFDELKTDFERDIYFSKAAYASGDMSNAIRLWHRAIYKDTLEWVMANSDYRPNKKETKALHVPDCATNIL